MSCPRPEEIYDLIEGHLDPERRKAVAAHLDACPGCRAWAEERRLLVEASAGLPDLPLPLDFPARVMARIPAAKGSAFSWAAAAIGALTTLYAGLLAYILLAGRSPAGLLVAMNGMLWQAGKQSVLLLTKVVKLGAVLLRLLGGFGDGLMKTSDRLFSWAGPGVIVSLGVLVTFVAILVIFGLGRKLTSGEEL
jgi:hypothetical protein